MFVLEAKNSILDNRLTLSFKVIVVVTSNNELHFQRSIYMAFKSVSAIYE